MIVVWPYEPFAYNGFGWYEPAKSAQIDLAMPSLTAPDVIGAKKAGGAAAAAALDSDVFPLPPIKKLSDGVAAASNSAFLVASKNAKARFDGLVAAGQVGEPWYVFHSQYELFFGVNLMAPIGTAARRGPRGGGSII